MSVEEQAAMGINEYARIIRRRWLQVTLVVVLSAVVAGAMSMLVDRTAQASAEIRVVAPATGTATDIYQSAVAAQMRLLTVQEVATADDVVARVARSTGISREAVRRQVVAKAVAGTLVLQISATAATPEMAVRLADAVADAVAGATRADDARFGGTSQLPIEVIHRARINGASTSTFVAFGSAGAAGAIGGFVLGAFIAVWREQLDRRREIPSTASAV